MQLPYPKTPLNDNSSKYVRPTVEVKRGEKHE